MTEIPYADENWNVTGGCTKCSPGCQNCYAIRLAHRFAYNPVMGDRYKGLVKAGNWTSKIKLFEDRLEQPLHWRNPKRVFVCSQADLFHPKVPLGFTCHVFDVIQQCPQHTFLLFTKRPHLMRKHLYGKWDNRCGITWQYMREKTILSNVQLFVSISTQAEADEKIPILLRIPAVVRGVSLEPLLEGISLRHPAARGRSFRAWDWIHKLDQVIIGAESGPKKRLCKLEWARNIVQQCQAAGVAVYVKQLIVGGKLVRDMPKFPPDLQVRQLVK